MTPEEAIDSVERGQLLPVYVLLGEERYLRTRVVSALRAAATAGAVPGFNEDEFTAGDADVNAVLGAARTLPMMAQRRWVLVRELDRWEGKTDDEPPSKSSSALDQLAEYAAAPSETSVVVLCANKLNGRRRLITQAKKHGFLVECQSLPKQQLPSWVQGAARARGHRMTASAAELVAEVAGPDLATMDDVIERASLFAGAGREITEDTIEELIPIVKPATVWQLVDAIGRRDRGAALSLLERVYEPADRGLRLLGVLSWSARQMLRFQAGLADGLRGADAAKAAGVPPFRARVLEQQLRRMPATTLERWLQILAEVDLRLKGASKLPPRAVLEAALIELCSQPASG